MAMNSKEQELSRSTSPAAPAEEKGGLGADLLRAVLATIVFTLLLGVIYPAIVWGVGQAAFSKQANGSLIKDASGQVIGSELLGQSFSAPQYFHGRPSAAFNTTYTGTNGLVLDITTSGGSNYGPTDARLIGDAGSIAINAAQVISDTGIATGTVPVDLVTTSASGLDPHITPAGADVQVARVAAARNLSAERVRQLVAQYTEGRDLGLLGEPRVNVLKLNLALDSSTK